MCLRPINYPKKQFLQTIIYFPIMPRTKSYSSFVHEAFHK